MVNIPHVGLMYNLLILSVVVFLFATAGVVALIMQSKDSERTQHLGRQIEKVSRVAFIVAALGLIVTILVTSHNYTKFVKSEVQRTYGVSALTVDKRIPQCSSHFDGYLSVATWKINASGSKKIGVLVGTPNENGTCRYQLKSIGEN